MIDYMQRAEYQSNNFRTQSIPKLVTCSQSISKKSFNKSYNHIFVLNLFKSRPELRRFWNDYFDWSMSFLFEAFISASLAQKNSCYLLLRSSLENFVKFLVVAINKRDEINDRGFKDNNHIILTHDWSNIHLNPLTKINTFQNDYERFSKLSHSAINLSSEAIINYFDKTSENFSEQFNDSMIEFRSLSKKYIYLIICICEDSFISWNQEELRLILKMIYKDHTLNTILKSLKK